MSVLYGDGIGGLGAPTLLTSPAWLGPAEDVHAADFDGDGRLDLAASATDTPPSGSGGLVTIFSNDPPGGFESDGDYPLDGDTNWGGLSAPDLNSDGFPDLVAANYYAGTISVLLHSGTDCDGNGLYDPEEIEDGLAQDCDGNGVIDACDIALDPGLDLNTNGVLDQCECLVSRYCTSTPNSTDQSGRIAALGIPSLSVNSFVLRAGQLPPGQFGIFFFGPLRLDPPLQFGDGYRCVGGLLTRLDLPLQIDGQGNTQLLLDLSRPPLDGFVAGDTSHFQFWYRDPQSVGYGFNLTDALEVTFCE